MVLRKENGVGEDGSVGRALAIQTGQAHVQIPDTKGNS